MAFSGNNTDTTSLYSTFKNISGGTKKFGFLPPHGQELAADEEFTVFGNLVEAMTRFERATDRRHHQAFIAAIENGDIEVVNTPAVTLKDVTTGETKQIELDNGTLTVVDPSWDAAFSDSDEDVPA